MPNIEWPFIAIYGILALSSLTSWLLSRLSFKFTQTPIWTNLTDRINSWWVMASILWIAVISGTTITILLFAIISWFVLRELVSVIPVRSDDHRLIAIGFYGLIPAQYIFIWLGYSALSTVFIPIICFLILPVFLAFKGNTEYFMQRTAVLQWCFMLSICCISYAAALLKLDLPAGEKTGLIIFLLAVSQLSDVFQYIFGKIWGKTLITRISPNKTWEGLVGGGLFAVLAGSILGYTASFTLTQSVFLATSIVLSGFTGGLVLSAIKRSLGIKDWGNMIKGHGGVLDRMDSVCFAAPIFYYLVKLTV